MSAELNYSREIAYIETGNRSDDSELRNLVFAAIEYVEERPEWVKSVRNEPLEKKLKFVHEIFDSNELKVNLPHERKNEKSALKCLDENRRNEALIYASEKETLAKIYFNRGLELAGGGFHSEAVEDFKEAVECSENEEILFRCHHRMAQSYSKLKKYSKAGQSLKKSLSHLAKSGLSEENKTNFNKILEASIKKLSKKVDQEDLIKDESEGNDDQWDVFKSKVKIERSRNRGRFLTADEDIKAGSVIAVEKPLAAIVNPDDDKSFMDYCTHCLKRNTRNPFPCPSCSGAIFCSKGCRKKAINAYHRYECELNLNALRKTENASSFRIFLTLKMIFRGIDSKFSEMTSHETDRDESDQIKYLVIASVLFRLLKLSGFEKCDEEMLKTLHDTIQIQDVNTHEVLALDESDRSQVGLVKVGNAINLNVGSVINHSCNPNTCRVNANGGELVLIATENISKGQEITDIYAMHYSEIPKEKRRNWLRDMFFFTCECSACAGNWATFEEMSSDVPEEAMSRLRQIESAIHLSLRKNDLDAAIALHIKDLEILREFCSMPHRLFVTTRNSLQFCFWRKYSV